MPALRVLPCLAALAGDWDALVEVAPVPSPFLRSWWLESAAGGIKRFVVVLDGDDLVGGVAFEEDRVLGVRRLRMMGDGPLCPDHLDLLAHPGREDEVVDAVAEWLGRQAPFLIELSGLAGGARLNEVFGRRARRAVMEPAPWTRLPADFATFLAARPSQVRNSVRQGGRRLAERGAVYRTAEDVSAGLGALLRLHAAQWGPRSAFVPVWARFAAAAGQGAARGELVLHEIVVGEEVIAAQAWFELAGRTSLYQGGRSTKDPKLSGAGGVLIAFILERACQRGFAEADFLRGDEEYKRGWTNEQRRLLRIRDGRGARARLIVGALEGRDAARRAAGQVYRSAPVRGAVARLRAVAVSRAGAP